MLELPEVQAKLHSRQANSHDHGSNNDPEHRDRQKLGDQRLHSTVRRSEGVHDGVVAVLVRQREHGDNRAKNADVANQQKNVARQRVRVRRIKPVRLDAFNIKSKEDSERQHQQAQNIGRAHRKQFAEFGFERSNHFLSPSRAWAWYSSLPSVNSRKASSSEAA